MSNISKLFKQVKGTEVLAQYFKNNLILVVSLQILILGISKKSLEIIRHITQFKLKRRLKRRFRHIKNKIDLNSENLKSIANSDTIWFAWLQGIENAPELVQNCYKSLKENLPEKKIIVITMENIFEYISFPDYITKKWKEGIITNTHLSDLLRIELLINHGGTWIDSTVFCTGNYIPSRFFNSELFVFQSLKPGLNGNSVYVSSWFMSSYTNNKILIVTRALLYEYWSKKDRMIDYFLLHYFFCIACEWYPEEYEKIPKFCNSVPHILQLELFSNFNVIRFDEIKSMTAFHKLTYKFDESKKIIPQTFYKKLFN